MDSNNRARVIDRTIGVFNMDQLMEHRPAITGTINRVSQGQGLGVANSKLVVQIDVVPGKIIELWVLVQRPVGGSGNSRWWQRDRGTGDNGHRCLWGR